MSRLLRVLSILMALVVVGGAQQKKRVAVMNFDYGTVHSSAAAIFGTNLDVGKGISDLLVDRLVPAASIPSSNARPSTRSSPNRTSPTATGPIPTLRPRSPASWASMRLSSAASPNSAATTRAPTSAAARSAASRGDTASAACRRTTKAVVVINARLIDTSTAEILAVASGNGESQRSGTSPARRGRHLGHGRGGAVDMRSSNFANTILGEAVTQSISQLASQLDQNACRLPTVKISVSGLVADASGGTLILNVGSRSGVKVGDKLQVTRKVREIKDPATGKVLRSIEDQLGVVTITEVDEQSSVGTFTGASPAKVGDVVKTAP